MYSNYDNSGKIRVLGSSEAAVAEATSATPPIKPQSQLSDIRHFNSALFFLFICRHKHLRHVAIGIFSIPHLTMLYGCCSNNIDDTGFALAQRKYNHK